MTQARCTNVFEFKRHIHGSSESCVRHNDTNLSKPSDGDVDIGRSVPISWDWTNVNGTFGSRAKKAFIALVLGGLAAALFTACIVVVAVSVSCASGGTAAAGAAIVAKTTTVFGVEVAKDCAIAAAVLGGAAVTLSVGLALAAPEMCSLSVLSTAQDIQKHLKEMIELGKKTQEELDALHNKCGQVKQPYDYLVKNSSRGKMEQGINRLIKYLDEYQKQGQSVNKSIEEAFDVLRRFGN